MVNTWKSRFVALKQYDNLFDAILLLDCLKFAPLSLSLSLYSLLNLYIHRKIKINLKKQCFLFPESFKEWQCIHLAFFLLICGQHKLRVFLSFLFLEFEITQYRTNYRSIEVSRTKLGKVKYLLLLFCNGCLALQLLVHTYILAPDIYRY